MYFAHFVLLLKEVLYVVGDNVSSVVAQSFGTIVMTVLAGVDDNF